MGFLETLARIPKILEANINDALDKAQDPQKMAKQLLVDYKRNLADVKEALAEVMADLDVAENKWKDAQVNVQRKTAAAMAAVQAGNQDDARTLIAAKQQAEVTAGELKKNYDTLVAQVNQMKAGYNKMVQDMDILQQRADIAAAKIQVAKTTEKMSKATQMASASKITDSFAQLEAQADRRLAKANAMAELDSHVETADEIQAKYERSATSPSVEAELASMMAAMGQSAAPTTGQQVTGTFTGTVM